MTKSLPFNSLETFHCVISTAKRHSVFLYFILEANEGICFYRTLEYTPHSPTRSVDIKGPISQKLSFEKIIEQLKKTIPLEIEIL